MIDVLMCNGGMCCRDIASAIRLLLDSVNNVFPYISSAQARQVCLSLHLYQYSVLSQYFCDRSGACQIEHRCIGYTAMQCYIKYTEDKETCF